MKKHGDAATPLWISEVAWGSAPPDSHGINKGPTGQAKMLKDAYNLFLSHRGDLEHREHLLVPLARPEALAGLVHLLLERGAA